MQSVEDLFRDNSFLESEIDQTANERLRKLLDELSLAEKRADDIGGVRGEFELLMDRVRLRDRIIRAQTAAERNFRIRRRIFEIVRELQRRFPQGAP